MNFLNASAIKELLLKNNAKPSRGLGQNFLIDKNILEKTVIAVEKDDKMVAILKESFKDFDNVQIIHGDILNISSLKFQISNYKIIANIPYYITSPIIRKFLEAKNPPEFLLLMVQKEVAQRICQSAPHMSLLSVAVQF